MLASSQEVEGLKDKVSVLEKDNTRLNSKTACACVGGSAGSANVSQPSLWKERDRGLAENKQLQGLVARLTHSNEDLRKDHEAIHITVKRIREERSKLKKENAKLQTDLGKRNKQQDEALAEAVKLKKEVSTAKGAHTNQAKEIVKLKEENVELELRLENQRKAADQETSGLHVRIAELQQRIEEMENRNEKKDRVIAELRAQFAQEHKQSNAATPESSFSTRMNEELASPSISSKRKFNENPVNSHSMHRSEQSYGSKRQRSRSREDGSPMRESSRSRETEYSEIEYEGLIECSY